MSNTESGGGLGELPESAEALLRLGLSQIDNSSWEVRSGTALAEATGSLTGPLTILGVMDVEKAVDRLSPVVGNALSSYDTTRLLQIDEDPSCRARAQREMLGAQTCAKLLAASPEVSGPLQKMPADAIEVHVPYAIELLGQEEAERNKVMNPIKRDRYLGGLFVGLRAVFGDATQAIKKVEPKKGGLDELRASQRPSHTEEEDFARGFSVIAAAVARVTGAITTKQAEASNGETEASTDGEVLYFPESFLSTSKAKPNQLGLIVAETKTPDYLGISMESARETAVGKSGVVEAELDARELEVLLDIRKQVNDLVLTYGTPSEKSNLPLGFDTIAIALARAKPEFVDIVRSLQLVPDSIIKESVMEAWRTTQETSSEIGGNKDQGAANKMLGLSYFPLLNSMCDGLHRQANHISGISKQGGWSSQAENQEAFRNGGRMHLKILAGIIDKLRVQPPEAKAA